MFGMFTSRAVFFGLGVAATAASQSSVARAVGRKAVREAIKGSIVAGRVVQQWVEQAKEELQDLHAEASSELDGKQSSPTGE